MKQLPPGGSYYGSIPTIHSLSTGGAANADATPTITVLLNGAVDATFVPTVAEFITGIYKISGTIPTSFVAGDSMQLFASFTVGGTAENVLVDEIAIVSADFYSSMETTPWARRGDRLQAGTIVAGGNS